MSGVLQGLFGLIMLIVIIWIIVHKVKKTVSSVKNFVTGSRGDGHSLGWQNIVKNMKYDLAKHHGYTVFKGACGHYNNLDNRIYEENYELRSYYNEGEYFFYSKYIGGDSWIRLDKEAITILCAICKKYFEWEEKASSEKVKIQKEIPDLVIITDVAWRKSNDALCLGNDLLIKFTFFSQSETRHQLVLDTNEVDSTESINTGWRFKVQIYFDKDQVASLQNAISEQHLLEEVPKIRDELEKLERSANAQSSFT
jgi:hypothetical protein